MLILISPAKTLDFETPAPIDRFLKQSLMGETPKTALLRFSQPNFLDDTAKLVKQLKQLSVPEISSLMKISDKLGELNSDRFKAWQADFDNTNAKQALLAFQGDVYQGMQVDNYQPKDFEFAQEHLRILSGLYGVLRPLDLIQPYRLEMGTKLAHAKLQDLSANTLYEFWADKLTQTLNQQLEKLDQKIIINLASNEYFKAVKPKLLEAEIIAPAFKDWKSGKYKIISFYAKKARGMMTSYIIKNRITKIEDLQNFAEAGYSYNPELSDPENPTFTRQLED